jgi:2-oxoglutarate dehydrogenase E1 component
LKACLEKYSYTQEVTWIQEETKNFGAWNYILERFSQYFPQIKLKYMGRKENASSAAGSSRQHKAEQKKLLEEAFS